jgi:hypothetical protein
LDHESLSFHWCADPGASIADQASIRSSSRAAKQGGTRRTRWDGKAKLYALVPRRSAACRRRAAGPRRGWSLDCCPVVVLGAMPSAGLPAGAVNPTGLDPRTPPRRRGPRQGCRGAEERSGAAPEGHWP